MEHHHQRARMPAIYLPHGGGPWPWMPEQEPVYRSMRAYLEGLAASLPEQPSALLVISAHWEAPVPTLMSSARPAMLYDYSGFPPSTYEVSWPAPGAPELALELQKLLLQSDIVSALDAERGFDHGTFVPLSVIWPEAQIPTLQLSLVRGLDPKTHLQLGKALAPLRDQGVLIIGSGMSYHNMSGFFKAMAGDKGELAPSREFDDWLAESVQMPQPAREDRLLHWTEAPSARHCHPREEHLMPLHVVAGAGQSDLPSLPFRDSVLGLSVSAIQFG